MHGDTKTEDRPLNRRIRVAPSTHEALKAAKVGDMTTDDVIRQLLRTGELSRPDPVEVLEEGEV